MTDSKKLQVAWTKHLPHGSKEKETFEKSVRNAAHVLERLRDVIEEYEIEIYQKESSESDYGEGWQFLQAHRNGKKEAFKTIKRLVEI